MRLTNGIYRCSPLSRARHHQKAEIYVRVEETDTKFILSWREEDNAKYYGGTYWDHPSCPITDANFNPLKNDLTYSIEGIEGKIPANVETIEEIGGRWVKKFELPKRKNRFTIRVTSPTTFLYTPVGRRSEHLFVLHDADVSDTNN